MKTSKSFPMLAFLIVVALGASTQSSSAVVPDQGPSAFGQGGFSFFNGFRTEQWNYSFDTVANKNGHARGRATFDILESNTQTQVVVKINCLEVIESSGILSAAMTGTVLHSDDPEFPKQANVIFAAEDDSASPILRPDIITRLFVFEGDCHDGAFPLTFFFQSPDAIHIQP